MSDDLDDFIAEKMSDPAFAKAYAKDVRKHDRFIRNRWRLCRLGVHLLSLSDGLNDYCVCHKRGYPDVSFGEGSQQ